MATEAASKIREYILNEATEPTTLREMVANKVYTPLQSLSEDISLRKLLEVESALVYKDITLEGDEENIRIYWKRCQNENGFHLKANNPSRLLATCSIQSPSLRSRRPFISPARIKKKGHEDTKPSSLTNSTPGRKSLSNSRRVSCKFGKVPDVEDLTKEVEELRSTTRELEEEIETLSVEYNEEELQEHIDRLHEYNEVKDMGQLLLGKLAEVEVTTTKSLYQRFGLELDN